MKAKDTLLLNNTINQNPVLARRAWFWRVVSHISKLGGYFCFLHNNLSNHLNVLLHHAKEIYATKNVVFQEV